MKVITAGRDDLEHYFTVSDVLHREEFPHTPFLVFIENMTDGEDCVTVKVVNTRAQLLEFPSETKVMSQWKGNWSSDFFQYTVGDFKEYFKIYEKEKETLKGGDKKYV